MSIYRLYIDESGHHRYQKNDYPAERYLGLTGVIVQKDIYEKEVVKRIESLRKPFYDDYDLRPPLHLTDIMSAKNGFSRLKNDDVRTQFDKEYYYRPIWRICKWPWKQTARIEWPPKDANER